nr:aconitate hydratase AcnA [Pseudomonadota bacterium]
LRVVPPGIGIVHQINLEYLARGVMEKDDVYYPDSVVGTDSHTTMINGVGVLGWGVGGIEAEAAMLGQPVYMLAPDVVGVHLKNKLPAGTTATDLVLTVTELLRNTKVVGKFVEFFGEGAAALAVPDRATIGNMAPEYGATVGFFPVDEKTIAYLRQTGRSEEKIAAIEAYYRAQNMFGIPRAGECDYTQTVELDLSTIVPSVAGPARPQDRIALGDTKTVYTETALKATSAGGYGKTNEELAARYPTGKDDIDIGDGDILIAAITSCTNTSNPSVLLAAGLVAKKAVARGIAPPKRVKTSLAPGSRVVSDYLEKSGLLSHLEKIGFHQVGYGCTTCIGNSGPLPAEFEAAIEKHKVVGVSVLSGNRNFEARVHQQVRANFLMSPPLVVAFALAGRIDIDLTSEPLATDSEGKPVYLKDIWPSEEEIAEVMGYAVDPENYRRRYEAGFENEIDLWRDINGGDSVCYQWQGDSTYIQKPPFFEDNHAAHDVHGARALAILGDSVTTDHISPAGAIKTSSPAGKFLQDKKVGIKNFNSYGARRGNHDIMMRGTFANVRIRNLMVAGTEGGVTRMQPGGEELPIYDAAMQYQQNGTPLILFAGAEYGTGSSRDWAAKGTRLLGVKAVVAVSYERIHRSNLVGMGIVPCQFMNGETAQSLNITGEETYDITGFDNGVTPGQTATLSITRKDGSVDSTTVLVRVDAPTESEYLQQGGILPYVAADLFATV